jgi:5-methylthioribose kinase
VLKQVREQLRVPEPWFCSIERIWREADVMEACHRAIAASPSVNLPQELSAIAVPQLLFRDRENYLIGMSAVPEHQVWKTQLLRGETDCGTASLCGRLLGAIHAATWGNPGVQEQLGDRSFFDALRLDPYYRHVARSHADVAPALDELVESLSRHPRCLVHGDFSPKNILVHSAGLTLVDFEVGHYGDPAFDLGFFLSHLVLKAVCVSDRWWDLLRLTFAFWGEYERVLLPTCGAGEFAALTGRSIANLGGCLLARVDGKSRVDYLNDSGQGKVRRLARNLLLHPPTTWSEAMARYVTVVVRPGP